MKRVAFALGLATLLTGCELVYFVREPEPARPVRTESEPPPADPDSREALLERGDASAAPSVERDAAPQASPEATAVEEWCDCPDCRWERRWYGPSVRVRFVPTWGLCWSRWGRRTSWGFYWGW